MLRKAVFGAAAAVAIILAAASPAAAHNCFNASRPAPTTAPAETGQWVYFEDFGVWAFSPPANYQNGTDDAWLLSNTPYCEEGGVVGSDGPRTTKHGIQSGCGLF